MPDVLIRHLAADVVERLKERARRNGRSLQVELNIILDRASEAGMDDARALAQRVRRRLASRRHTDSAKLVAEDRRR